MAKIRIHGHLFIIPDIWHEGDILDAPSASALNQLRAENIRNNMAKEFARLDNPLDESQMQQFAKRVMEYAETYTFQPKAIKAEGGLEAEIKRAAQDLGLNEADPEVQMEARRRLSISRAVAEQVIQELNS